MDYKLEKQLRGIGSLEKQLRDIGYNGKLDLSSLIRACGKKFCSLSKYGNYSSWIADGGIPICGVAKTPEKAVAKLYIHLYKQKLWNKKIK